MCVCVTETKTETETETETETVFRLRLAQTGIQPNSSFSQICRIPPIFVGKGDKFRLGETFRNEASEITIFGVTNGI